MRRLASICTLGCNGVPLALLCWRVTRLRARSGARSSPRHHRRRYAIAVAEEAQKSDSDLKPTRNRGECLLNLRAVFCKRARCSISPAVAFAASCVMRPMPSQSFPPSATVKPARNSPAPHSGSLSRCRDRQYRYRVRRRSTQGRAIADSRSSTGFVQIAGQRS
jgi:hypothetical protein